LLLVTNKDIKEKIEMMQYEMDEAISSNILLMELMGSLVSWDSLEGLMQNVLKNLCEYIGSDRAVFSIKDKKRFCVLTTYGACQTGKPLRSIRNDSLLGFINSLGSSIIIPDLSQDTRFKGDSAFPQNDKISVIGRNVKLNKSSSGIFLFGLPQKDTLTLKGNLERINRVCSVFIPNLVSKLNSIEDRQKLRESESYLSNIVASVSDMLIVLNYEGIIKMTNRAMGEVLGYSKGELIGKNCDLIIMDDLFIQSILNNSIQGQRESIFKKRDGVEIPVLLTSAVIRGTKTEGEISDIVCVANDLTALKEAEKQTASLKEKEILLQEIHHRVKNNMQIISSLLQLQSKQIDNEKYQLMFKTCQLRIESMALIHHKLYQSDDLCNLDFKSYVNSLTKNLLVAFKKGECKLEIEIENIQLNTDTAIPCGLILNEIISNSLKYAFPKGVAGIIRIMCRHIGPADQDDYLLEVSDNGIGFPESVTFKKGKSLGTYLIKILVEDQLDGEFHVDRSVKGTKFIIRFKKQK